MRSIRIVRWIALAAASVVVAACGDKWANPNLVTNNGVSGLGTTAAVSVAPALAQLAVGATAQLTATARDGNAQTLLGKTFTWTSSDTTVARVSSSGLVSGVGQGAATISAMTDGISGNAAVVVGTSSGAGQTATTLTVSPATISMTPGASAQLVALARDQNGNVITGAPISWTSGNTAVASVSSAGIVTANAVGNTAVTASLGNLSANANVSVAASSPPGTPSPSVASMSVSPSSVTLAVGGTATVTATPRDANGNPLSGRVITWATANPNVASVSSSGTITGQGPGSTTVTATSEGVSADVGVTVTPAAPAPPSVTSVSVNPGTGSVCVGSSLQMTATPRDATGQPVSGQAVTWAVTPSSVASISQNGLLAALGPGNAHVTATSGAASGSADITICPVVASVEVTAPQTVMSLAGSPTVQLTATAKDSQGNVVANQPVTWTITPSNLASITPNGTVTGLSIGDATATATINGVKGNIGLHIVP